MTESKIADVAWAAAMLIGVSSIAEVCAHAVRDGRLTISFDRPWMLTGDALRLTTWTALVWAITHPWPRPYAAVGIAWAAIVLHFCWCWVWGFLCHPRRTRLGQWVDDVLSGWGRADWFAHERRR